MESFGQNTYKDGVYYGNLSENIVATDLEGKTYDIFALLDEGKYLLVHSIGKT